MIGGIQLKIDNHYEHFTEQCKQVWTMMDCESFCKDKCRVCNKYINPTSSTLIDKDGTELEIQH